MIFIKKTFICIVIMLCLFAPGQAFAESYQMHTVKSGETYYELAKIYGIDVNTLMSINSQPSNMLKPKDLIKIQQIKDVNVKVNGNIISFDVQPYIENGCVFVPIRFISDALAVEAIDWDQTTKTAIIKSENKNIEVKVGSSLANINGQVINLDAPVQLYEDRTFVPVRFFSETLGVDSINWDENTNTVVIEKKNLPQAENNVSSNNTETAQNYSDEDLYWLSRLVQVEAGFETFEGKVGVANTIINRKNSPSFPKTIKAVILDTKYGVQFPPAHNGLMDNAIPSDESISAAKKALEGYNNVGESLYFINSKQASGSWVAKNRTYFCTIGSQSFYL